MFAPSAAVRPEVRRPSISMMTSAACTWEGGVDKDGKSTGKNSGVAKAALINDMLQSPDPHIRAKGASIAEKFLTEPKKNIFGF